MNFYSLAHKNFTGDLLRWDSHSNQRQMPWKGEKDPYKVWLSEVILQQTRVDQGLLYYQKFVETFPDVHALALAPEEQVMKMWEGLGYYSRCRNLHSAARHISFELNGVFPTSFEKLLKLKGVGEYTASAIASFAFDQPFPVVDGNVYRLLSRVFDIKDPIDTTTGKRNFKRLANELIDRGQPGRYNQAIMDHGATVCKPVSPVCDGCVFQKYCTAFNADKVTFYPVKLRKTQLRNRWFYYLVIENENNILLKRRTGKDIWRGLYEFCLVERNAETDYEQLLVDMEKTLGISQSEFAVKTISPQIDQKLTHQRIRGRFIRLGVRSFPSEIEGDLVPRNELHRYPFPRFINEYIRDHYTN